MECGKYKIEMGYSGGKIYECELEAGHSGNHHSSWNNRSWSDDEGRKNNDDFWRHVNEISQIEPA